MHSDWREQWGGVGSNSLLSHYNTAIVGRGKVRHAVTGWSSGVGWGPLHGHRGQGQGKACSDWMEQWGGVGSTTRPLWAGAR